MNANLFQGRAEAQDVVDAVRDNDVDILVLEETTPGLLAEMDARRPGRRCCPSGSGSRTSWSRGR